VVTHSFVKFTGAARLDCSAPVLYNELSRNMHTAYFLHVLAKGWS
jgi:hypothetical protein